MKFYQQLCLAFIFLSACSSVKHKEDSFAEHYRARQILNSYEPVKDSELKSYFAFLLGRLAKDQKIKFSLSMVRSQDPLALSPGDKKIIISTNLLAKMQNEAQLAFAIAHEMSHYILNHKSDTGENRKSIELEADQKALNIIFSAGYDASEAIKAVRIFYNSYIDDPNYPTPIKRYTELAKKIEDRNWAVSGTIDRRDFVRIKKKFAS